MDADWGDAGSTIESSTDCSTDGHRSDSAWSIIQPRVVHDVEQNDIATVCLSVPVCVQQYVELSQDGQHHPTGAHSASHA